MYLAVIAAAMMVACNGKKTAQDETKNDSVCVADSVSADVDLAAGGAAHYRQPVAL